MALLERLTVRDFRNIPRAEFHFPSAGVVIVGDNGQGKTNLLEAIYYFQLVRSLRGARDADLVRLGTTAFHLHATVTTNGRHELSVGFSRGRKKVVVDGAETRRLSAALGSLPATVISPRDVDLVRGAPSERRRFVDIVLALTSPRYLNALQQYRGALSRRNAALRGVARGSQSLESVAVWEPALAESGAVLLAERVAWMEKHESDFARLTEAIGEREPLTMRYVTSISTPRDARTELADALARRRDLDVRRGITHSGPHRDDVSLQINAHDLRVFGSGGQQRTAAMTLRLLEAETLKAHCGGDPVLLLDDPFAELDARRSARILALLRETVTGQTILTVPRAGDIPGDMSSLPRWHLSDGHIVEGHSAPGGFAGHTTPGLSAAR
ncbi:MAG: DNA replication/repair protein RecF [Gemmatimonadota bacterium]|nr:DNA replication/repair protein RecF [Gemmatimonadota bacterium]